MGRRKRGLRFNLLPFRYLISLAIVAGSLLVARKIGFATVTLPLGAVVAYVWLIYSNSDSAEILSLVLLGAVCVAGTTGAPLWFTIRGVGDLRNEAAAVFAAGALLVWDAILTFGEFRFVRNMYNYFCPDCGRLLELSTDNSYDCRKCGYSTPSTFRS
jgi:hypothetical protein